MNAVDDDILNMLNEAVDEGEKNYAGIVVGNEAESAFSAGANLMLIWMLSQQKQWSEIERAALTFQGVTRRLHTATVPVVAAPFGLALGGGCEVALGCTAIRANAELYMGLVEVGAGVIPAGGGCRMMLDRWLGDLAEGVDPLQYVRKVFEIIGMAKVSMSAEEARAYRFLNERDGVTMNRDQLIHDAKETVLGLARAGYRPAPARALRLPGESGYATIRAGLWAMVKSNQISEHDALIGSKLAKILTGGAVGPNTVVSEERLFELEREAFLSLCGEEKSQARMQSLLTSGKPLRN
jgi:3-hydroxyacyl-CoA dehydrogenase